MGPCRPSEQRAHNREGPVRATWLGSTPQAPFLPRSRLLWSHLPSSGHELGAVDVVFQLRPHRPAGLMWGPRADLHLPVA